MKNLVVALFLLMGAFSNLSFGASKHYFKEISKIRNPNLELIKDEYTDLVQQLGEKNPKINGMKLSYYLVTRVVNDDVASYFVDELGSDEFTTADLLLLFSDKDDTKLISWFDVLTLSDDQIRPLIMSFVKSGLISEERTEHIIKLFLSKEVGTKTRIAVEIHRKIFQAVSKKSQKESLFSALIEGLRQGGSDLAPISEDLEEAKFEIAARLGLKFIFMSLGVDHDKEVADVCFLATQTFKFPNYLL